MILLIDVGNSSLSCALVENDKFIKNFRITSFKDKTSDEYYLLFNNMIDLTKIKNIAIASVVPQITATLKELFEKYTETKILILQPKVKTNIKVIADNPREVGADLICNAKGLEVDEALIIDLGTATKYIYVKNNTIMGLAIAPGVEISLNALVSNAALLPEIDLNPTKKILCNNTINCMQSGVVYSTIFAVEGFIKEIKKEVNNPNLDVIITGGLAQTILSKCSEKVYIDEFLTLKGLYNIYKINE